MNEKYYRIVLGRRVTRLVQTMIYANKFNRSIFVQEAQKVMLFLHNFEGVIRS